MKRFYPILFTLATSLSVGFLPTTTHADFFGGDLPLLAQILSNAIQELATLQQMMRLAKGDSDLLAKVNRDIESSLSEIYAMQSLVRETTDIGKIKDPQQLLIRLQDIYGKVPKIGDLKGIEFNDRIAGNAIGVDNDTYDHAKIIDNSAVLLQDQARRASPGRAAQLTAQSQTTILHSLAQIERTNATLVRVTSAHLALENQKQKNKIESFDQGYSAMASSHASDTPDLHIGGLN